MRRLLDSSSQRMIKILETLLESEDWTNFSNLSISVNASERTVAKDITLLKEKWKQNLNMEVSKKNGVILKNQNIASIGLVFTDIFNDSIALKWIKDLIFHPDNTIEFYEKRLFTSRSVLIRMLPKINKYLSEKGMFIQHQYQIYSFTSEDENHLRDFSASFLLELYGISLEKFDLDIDLQVISDLIMSIMKNNSDLLEFNWHSKDDLSITYNIIFYIVSIVRENNGYNIFSNYPAENEISPENLIYLKHNFSNINLHNLKPIHEYIKNKFNGWSSYEEKCLVTSEIDLFYKNLFSDLSIIPDDYDKAALNYVIKGIYFYTKMQPFKTSDLFNRIYCFSLSIRRSNPVLYESADKNLKLFSKLVGLDISCNISAFLFWLCLICPETTQTKKHHSAILISDFGGSHASFLKEVICNFFNTKPSNYIKIDILTCPDVSINKDLSNYDILITTTPQISSLHKKTVLINDYPTSDDFYKIFKSLNYRITY